jgi:hypothetical protein
MDTGKSRLLLNCFLTALVYVATTWVAVWLLGHALADAAPGLRALVALLPVLPIVLVVRILVQMVLAGDELQQRIDLEAIAISALGVSLGALTLSLLMVAGVINVTGRQALVWVFPAIWIAYGFARAWAARRYR